MSIIMLRCPLAADTDIPRRDKRATKKNIPAGGTDAAKNTRCTNRQQVAASRLLIRLNVWFL